VMLKGVNSSYEKADEKLASLLKKRKGRLLATG
jgi:hypothetical protein